MKHTHRHPQIWENIGYSPNDQTAENSAEIRMIRMPTPIRQRRLPWPHLSAEHPPSLKTLFNIVEAQIKTMLNFDVCIVGL